MSRRDFVKMELRRRQFVTLAAGLVAMPGRLRMAKAQSYPARPVRIVVGFTAGGIYDTYARLIAQWRNNQDPYAFRYTGDRRDIPNIIETEIVVEGRIPGII